jgi:16S rRNA (guanine527-N7)-methyltransferase
MNELSDTEIEDLLGPYGVPQLPGMYQRIRSYISLLLKWNRAISLTTVTDPAEIVKFHFGESLFASSAVDFGQSRLADVGSGAGFPGLPLAVGNSRLHVMLIESNTRKCAFLSEVARQLQLANVTVFRGRMEEFPDESEPFGFITARALGHHDDLLTWAKKGLEAAGRTVLWLGDEDSSDLSRRPDWNWQERILIPGSERRYLLVGTPRGSNP